VRNYPNPMPWSQRRRITRPWRLMFKRVALKPLYNLHQRSPTSLLFPRTLSYISTCVYGHNHVTRHRQDKSCRFPRVVDLIRHPHSSPSFVTLIRHPHSSPSFVTLRSRVQGNCDVEQGQDGWCSVGRNLDVLEGVRNLVLKCSVQFHGVASNISDSSSAVAEASRYAHDKLSHDPAWPFAYSIRALYSTEDSLLGS
jgi:hypothetical protein